MAKAIYNRLKDDDSITESAGTNVIIDGHEGMKLNSFSELVAMIECMKEDEIDLSNEVCKQLTYQDVDKADIIVNMAERFSWPNYLVDNPKTIIWDIVNPSFVTHNIAHTEKQNLTDKIKTLLQHA